jgi:glyoxylase-like metal-dependent hydrolase (beta-lactamase superfamily II)
MLDGFKKVSKAKIGTLVNTHHNGDHCYGNGCIDGCQIIATAGAAEAMKHETPRGLAQFMKAAPGLGLTGEYLVHCFGDFDFENTSFRAPDQTFTGHTTRQVGDKLVELIEVGPAHTAGDVLVHLPAERAIFTGDILFVGGSPIAWAGPLSNWVAACDLILGLDVDVVVPGHGPVTDKAGVVAVRDELAFVDREASARFAAGMDAWDAAREIYRMTNGDLGERGRVAVNVETVYRSLDPTHTIPPVPELFRRMAELES